eukprot:scaffold1_cov402-Prasinococcus_capsulatus_cf.AAC.77
MGCLGCIITVLLPRTSTSACARPTSKSMAGRGISAMSMNGIGREALARSFWARFALLRFLPSASTPAQFVSACEPFRHVRRIDVSRIEGLQWEVRHRHTSAMTRTYPGPCSSCCFWPSSPCHFARGPPMPRPASRP